MTAPLPISGVVITKNEADRIGRCLDSMRAVCTELVVVDSGSDDDTVAVARAHGARVEHQDWLGYAAQKNHAIGRASQPWLLLLDADEWLADGAADAICALFADGRVEQADGWVFQRRNWFMGRRLRGGEPSERLVRPDWRYLPALVHERPDLAGKRLAPIDAEIEHDTARSYDQHLRKQERYAALWAEQKQGEGRSASWLSPYTHVAAYWLKSYLLRAGWRDGRAGFWFHRAHAHSVWTKYHLLRARTR